MSIPDAAREAGSATGTSAPIEKVNEGLEMLATRAAVMTAALILTAGRLPAADVQTVRFKAADGTQIYADYVAPESRPAGSAAKAAPPAPIALLIHATNGERRDWKPLIEPLHKAGFGVLALDLRGCGESSSTEDRAALERRDAKLYDAMQDDLRGAYDWLAQRPELDRARFAIVACGDATALALQYAAKDVSVDGVVCVSPVLELPGCDARGDARQITGRKLLLIGNKTTQEAGDQVKSLNQGAQTRVLDAAAAGAELLKDSAAGSEMVTFVKSAVGRPSEELVYVSIESDKGVYHERGSKWVERISPTNLRVLSSKDEAEARGLRAARSKQPGDKGAAAGPTEKKKSKK